MQKIHKFTKKTLSHENQKFLIFRENSKDKQVRSKLKVKIENSEFSGKVQEINKFTKTNWPLSFHEFFAPFH